MSLYLPKREFKKYTDDELSIRKDIIFRLVFGSKSNIKYLKDLLESLLHINITSLEVRSDVSLDKIHADNKNMRLDILAEVDGKDKINIEMQNKNNYNVIKRGEAYASYITNDSLKNGDDYSDLPKIVVVWILSFDLFKDDGPYHEESLTVRAYNSEILSDNFKYHFFQLPKFIKNVKEIITPEEQWLAYLSCQLNNNELEELFKMNRSIEEIDKIVDIVMTDKDVQDALLTKKLQLNKEALIAERQREEKAKEIAKKLKSLNVPFETIIESTGLTKEEIEKL